MAITKTYNDTYNITTTVNDNDIIVVQKGENSDLASMAKTTIQAIRQPLYDSIANASLAQTGTTGSFIEKVSESSGKISVTVTPFATGITNTTASQPVAPSADAVVKYVNAESTTGAINTRITQRISELNANNVGETGSYIKTISENSGVITATSQAFESSVTDTTGNAPNSKAVKVFVEDKIGALTGNVGNANTLIKSLVETSGVLTGTTIALDSSSLASGVPTSQAVKNAIGTLTGSVGASNAKLVTSITETDGKITGTTIDITNEVDTSASKIPTSKAVNDRIQTSIYSALSALDFPNASNASQSYGANGNYIKYVKQVDGQFSAEMKKFDTYTPVSGASPNTGTWSATPSDDNVPSSKAVTDYVSTRFNALDYNLPGTGASGTFLRWVKQTDGQLDSSYVAFENNTTGIAKGTSDTAASAAATGLVYSSDSDRAPTVKAVASQVARLDKRADAIHAEVTGLNYNTSVTAGYFISGLTQSTGKLSASLDTLSTAPTTGVKKAITSEAVKTAIDALDYNTATTGTGGATGASGTFLRWVRQIDGKIDAKEVSFENNSVSIANNTSSAAASAASPTYSSDSDKAPTVKAVASQVARLDKRADAIHAEVTGLNYNTSVSDGYYISGLTQATGKLSTSTAALATTATTGNKKAITSEAVRTAIDALDYNTSKTGTAGTFLRWVSQTDGKVDSCSVAFKSDALASVALSASGIRTASSYAKATDTTPNVTIVTNEIDRLDSRIDSINNQSTGPLGNTKGYYIYSVQQNKGNVLAATASRFDTTVGPTTGTGAATDDNAPTSKAVRNAINALTAASVGADDSYLKTIVEKTGIITTTTKKFDNYTRGSGWVNNGTGITPNNNNVPSTEAVENRVEEAKRQILSESEALVYLGKVNNRDDIINLASRAASKAGRDNRYDAGDTFIAGANFNLTGSTGITGTTGYQVYVGDMIVTNASSKAYSADIFDIIGGSDKTVLYDSPNDAVVGNFLMFDSSSGRLVSDSGENQWTIQARVSSAGAFASLAASFANNASSSAAFADAEVEPYRASAASSASAAFRWESSSASSAKWANNRADTASSSAVWADDRAGKASSSADWAKDRGDESSSSAAWALNRASYSASSAGWSEDRAGKASSSATWAETRADDSSSSAVWADNRADTASSSAVWADDRAGKASSSADWAKDRGDKSSSSAAWAKDRADKASSYAADANLEGIKNSASSSADWAKDRADKASSYAAYSNSTNYAASASSSAVWANSRAGDSDTRAYAASSQASYASSSAGWAKDRADKSSSSAGWAKDRADKASSSADWSENRASCSASSAGWAKDRADKSSSSATWAENRASCSASSATYSNSTNYAASASSSATWATDRAGKASSSAVWANSRAGNSDTRAYAASSQASYASSSATWAENRASCSASSAGWSEDRAGKASSSAAWAKDRADKASSSAEYSNSTNYAASASSSATWAENRASCSASSAGWALNRASCSASSAGWSEDRAGKASSSATWAKDRADKASSSADWSEDRAGKASSSATWAKDRADKASSSADWSEDRAGKASSSATWAKDRASCSASSANYAATGFLDKITTTAQTVAGYVSFSTGIQANSFTATSSRKVKENIHPTIISALDLIKTVNVVDFNYIADDEKTPHIGFIAEDTDTLLSTPHLNGMDYTNCIGTLLKAVQEITKGMEKLEKRIENLE